MLLIFDLDDTLIPTTTELTARKLVRAFDRMVEAGLNIEHQKDALTTLLRMNLAAPSTWQLLEEFVELMEGTACHHRCAIEEIEKVDLEIFDLPEASESIALLKKLRDTYHIALVTRGNEVMQRAKLEAFGIDETLFNHLIVTPKRDKERWYAHLMQEYDVEGEEVVVVGDRVGDDLAGAKRLGATTVQVKRGRGANAMPHEEIVDHIIYSPEELPAILENLKALEIV